MQLSLIGVFFSGVFSANAVPHFVQGISGNKFPTPFAKPPGQGLSSPLINVCWALVNIAIAWAIVPTGSMGSGHPLGHILFFAGMVLISIPLSIRFQSKHKE